MTADPRPQGLRLFLDSADCRQWDRLLPLGIFHGVTTNPLLLERAGLPCTLAQLFNLTQMAADRDAGEIHLQTWGNSVQEMVATGLEIAQAAELGPRVLVKVPVTPEGLQAARILRGRGVGITLTAVFQPGQVMAAAALGAAYAAPYLGRLDDAGRDGETEIFAMQGILQGTGSPTRLLVASLRRPGQVIQLAAAGLDTFTLGPGVAEALIRDELTEQATAAFQQAAVRKMKTEM